MGLLGLFLFSHPKILTSKITHLTLVGTLLFQSLLAIFQFHTQRSFSNYLFLGETNLANYSGLAKGVFDGAEKILPYGTTAHPNILGGVLVVFGLLVAQYALAKWQEKNYFKLPVVIYTGLGLVSLYALYLTQSLSAGLGLILSLPFLRLFTTFLAKNTTICAVNYLKLIQ